MNNLKPDKHAHGYVFVKDVTDAFDITTKVQGEQVLNQKGYELSP
jgi:hypothetical protein